ncbi:MAG: pilus assembly FimT family protein [Acidiferrobacter sp.]
MFQPRGPRRPRAGGYTLLEVIVVLILMAILAAILAPRFIDTSGFTGQTTADQLLAAARYAETLAQNQDVATDLTVTAGSFQKPGFFQVTQNGTPVPNPALQSSTLVVNLPTGVTITPYLTITFQRQLGTNFKNQGLPNKAKTFTIKSAGPVVKVYVTATGYIYECQVNGPCP